MSNRFHLKCWAAAVAATAVLSCALSALAQQAAPPATGAAAMRSLADEFFTWRAVTQPVTGDDVARIERPAGWTPDVSPGALGGEAEKLAEFRKRFSALKPEAWPVVDRVDYLLLRSAIERVDWELNVLRLPRRDPRFYYDQTAGALFEQLTQPPPFTEARARNILACVEAIPCDAPARAGELDRTRGRLGRCGPGWPRRNRRPFRAREPESRAVAPGSAARSIRSRNAQGWGRAR